MLSELLSSESIPNVRAMEVVLGAHNINQEEASQQRIKVKKFLRHPLFTGLNQYDYDIMLLKVDYLTSDITTTITDYYGFKDHRYVSR